MKKLLLIKGAFLLTIMGCLSHSLSGHQIVLDDKKVQLDPVSFPYEVFYNTAFHLGNLEWGTRNMAVLIEEKDFSEENLKEIFRILPKGYPKPTMLYIELVTSREQIRPTKWPTRSDEPDPPNFHKRHWARYSRSSDREYFRYNVNPPSSDLKTIVLMGFDPAVRRKE